MVTQSQRVDTLRPLLRLARNSLCSSLSALGNQGFDLLRFIKPPVILFAATSTILSSSLAHLEMFDSAVPNVFEAY